MFSFILRLNDAAVSDEHYSLADGWDNVTNCAAEEEIGVYRAFVAIVASLLAAAPVLAALPPQFQRQRELQAIIASPEVVDAFGFDGIGSIEYTGDDVYVVKGGVCSLEVTIVDVPTDHEPGWAGPRQFTILVGETVCE